MKIPASNPVTSLPPIRRIVFENVLPVILFGDGSLHEPLPPTLISYIRWQVRLLHRARRYQRPRMDRDCPSRLEIELSLTLPKWSVRRKITCGGRFCPSCSPARARRAATRVAERYSKHAEQGRLGTSLFVTLRGSECAWDDVRESVETLLRNARRLFHVKSFPGTGLIANVDFTRLSEDRIRPHLHVIVHVQKSYYNSRRYWSSDRWAEVWGGISGVRETGSIKVQRLPEVDDVSRAARYSLSLITNDNPGDWTVEEPMRLQTLIHGIKLTRTYGDLRAPKVGSPKKQSNKKVKSKSRFKVRADGTDGVGEQRKDLVTSNRTIRQNLDKNQRVKHSSDAAYAGLLKERYEYKYGTRTGKNRAFRVRVGRLPVYPTNENIERALQEFSVALAARNKQYQQHPDESGT